MNAATKMSNVCIAVGMASLKKKKDKKEQNNANESNDLKSNAYEHMMISND